MFNKIIKDINKNNSTTNKSTQQQSTNKALSSFKPDTINEFK